LKVLTEPSAIRRPTQVSGVMKAVKQVIYSQLNPAELNSVTVSGLGLSGRDVDITIDGSGGRTVLDTLNQIALQGTGYAWMLWTETDGAKSHLVRLGVLARKGDRHFTDYAGPITSRK
jgi:hypothetical protein